MTSSRWLALSFTCCLIGTAACAKSDSGSHPSSSAPAPQPPPTAAVAAGPLAPQPGPAYALMLGPSSIDDGLSRSSDTGRGVAKALGAAADAFGSGESPASSTSSPASAAARSLDAAIPPSEYDLTELAKALPADADVLYRFVTDRIIVDGYDGVMRGPLVTWMTRAGSPSDKTVLLAWLFVTKNIPYQFVRGSLSPADRTRIAKAAASAAPAPTVDPKVASYADALTKEGGAFADWARGLLSAKNIQVGGGPAAADRVSSRHYWIQITRGNAIADLDPTIPGSAAGTHLGAIDSSFKPTSVLPTEEWHYVQIQVVASFADNITKTIIDHREAVANLAYAPIRLVIAPSGSVDPMQPAAATAFDAGLQIGSTLSGSAHLDLGSGQAALRSVILDVRRKGPDGATIGIARRTIVDARTPDADRALRLAGMTTMLVVPGRGAMAFATHMQFRALQQLVQDSADAADGKAPALHPWYPIRIIDYYRRDDTLADQVASAGGARLYRDRPNVAMLRTAFERSGTTTNAVTTFDIAENGMGSMAAQGDAAIRENMIRGYADTKIERDVLENPADNGTIALFAAAKAQAVAPAVLAERRQTSDVFHDGLDQTLASGQVAIAPSSPVRVDGLTMYGWWAIDPKTGNTVGRMTGGVGQANAEYGITINTISKAYTLYGQLETGATCLHSGMGSAGCMAAVCASLASYAFGGGSLLELASNVAAGRMATAGCNSGFGVK